jgi:3-vinyl bacteriochlorophyllide hydratase
MASARHRPEHRTPLYTPEQRLRRDGTVWTLVQGVLAPVQFLACLVSFALILRYLATGADYEITTASIIVKTALLYTIMVTGAIWEKIVFGQYLLAPAFFWEDVFSFFVIAAHTVYVVGLYASIFSSSQLMGIALLAYGLYAINATQFILKLRAARLDAAGRRDARAGREALPHGAEAAR